MNWIDGNDQVIAWGSETIIVPYLSPVDNRFHRYFLDFKMKVLNNSGEVKTYIVEIKPEIQTIPPKSSTNTSKRYLTEVMTYGVNCAKWKAAESYAHSRNWEFIILTEKHLNINQRKNG